MKFITRLAKIGYLQPKQLQAALWLQDAPDMPELIEECRLIALRTHRPTAPAYQILMGAIRRDVPFRMDETTVGMMREALNAAHRLMVLSKPLPPPTVKITDGTSISEIKRIVA